MSEFPPDARLADALRSLPAPALPADFDERVLAALRVPAPWWRRVWQQAQPLVLGTSCSLALTLLLLHLTLSAPAAPMLPAAPANLAAAPSAPMPPLDVLLDRPNLCAGSLASAWTSPPAPNNGGVGTGNVGGRPKPRRHAEIGRRAVLLA